jgi:hypothetical protein
MKAEVLLFIVLWRPHFTGMEARLVLDYPRMLMWESATGPELLLQAVSNLNAQGEAKQECPFLIRSSLNTAPNLQYTSLFTL